MLSAHGGGTGRKSAGRKEATVKVGLWAHLCPRISPIALLWHVRVRHASRVALREGRPLHTAAAKRAGRGERALVGSTGTDLGCVFERAGLPAGVRAVHWVRLGRPPMPGFLIKPVKRSSVSPQNVPAQVAEPGTPAAQLMKTPPFQGGRP